MGVGRFRGRDDGFPARARPTERDVVADRSTEQMHMLADVADLSPQRVPRGLRYLLSVDGYAARLRVVEAQQQRQDRRFAASRGSDERGYLPGLGNEAHVADDRLFQTIGETHARELDSSPLQLQ